LVLLAAALGRANALPARVELLRQAQRRHPGDFWINHNLAWCCMEMKPARAEEVIGFYRAALALRPHNPGVHVNLGIALMEQGKLPEAVAAYRQAIALRPDLALAYNNLGIALRRQNKLADAIAAHRQAIALQPDSAYAHYGLGLALKEQGKLREAVAAYRQAIALQPEYDKAYNGLGLALQEQGKLAEAVAAYRQAIALQPDLGAIHFNLGLALERQGNLPEAVAAYRTAITLQPDLATAHFNLGGMLVRQGRLAEAEAACREATELQPDYAEACNNLGLTLQQQGRFAEAVTVRKQGLQRLPPDHALRPTLQQDIRTCERFLELDRRLPSVLKGEAKPAGAAELIEFADLCQAKRLYAAAARFFAEAFADQAKRAEDPRAGHRYNAACAAALAAAGQGEGAKLDAKERGRLCRQALDWLRDDLALWAKQLDGNTPQARAQVRQELRHWQQDPDLAGLRDAAALGKLPAGEPEAWCKLWADVDGLLKRAGEAKGPPGK
jgi:Flp pilus assembly protein TadD